FYSGLRPAVNVGISVSRVGGAAQTKAMKAVAGRLRLDLAQYRELEAFAQFGSELDSATQKQLARGERIVEVLKQPQYAPVPVDQQVMILYAVTNGLIDDVPTNRVRAFEAAFLEFMQTQRPQTGEAIRSSGKLEKDTIDALVAGVNDFKQTFLAEQQDAVAKTAVAQTAERPKTAESPATEKSNTDASTPANPAA
ncbi:MAG: F0F1 ATP synthase subunit alpha, partial [Longimicrobiales bacterium]